MPFATDHTQTLADVVKQLRAKNGLGGADVINFRQVTLSPGSPSNLVTGMWATA